MVWFQSGKTSYGFIINVNISDYIQNFKNDKTMILILSLMSWFMYYMILGIPFLLVPV